MKRVNGSRSLMTGRLSDATLSMTNPDPTFPVERLYDPIKERRAQSSGVDSVITAQWPGVQASSVFLGFHNLSFLSIVVSGVNGQIAAQSFSSPRQNVVLYFEPQEITKVVITISTTNAQAFVGSVEVGEYLQLVNVGDVSSSDIEDTGEFQRSPGGQFTFYEGERLESFSLSQTDVKVSEYESLKSQYRKGRPFWFDRYPETDEEPLFVAGISDIRKFRRGTSSVTYDLSFDLAEAR